MDSAGRMQKMSPKNRGCLPLYGALLAHLFLGKPVGLSHLVGGALIVGGGLWAARGR